MQRACDNCLSASMLTKKTPTWTVSGMHVTDTFVYPTEIRKCAMADNDCDNLTDILPDGSPVVEASPCATGLAGLCAQGHLVQCCWKCCVSR